MSEVKVNQWDELSQFLFREKRFTNPIATNGALLEGFMFVIGWRKCIRCHSIVHMSWFGALVQDHNASHANPYACAGFNYFKQFLTPGKASDNLNANLYACAGSNNAQIPCACGVFRQFTRKS
ncbi:hypothetical protein O181_128849 [Austropuccinia psidii MF-1]|uniref:Tet-like 2OG-Fe(II) oxygenase domain-containing protein n=1 Tax=Austropuccinia psidii MF-1 TaxID=1389203 RepID=A0A9Q3L0U0_9BASI|nr:hypothetical protein [Austropuccinia psidii MF-1]